MSATPRLADLLATLLREADHPYTAGSLARRSGVPKMTIVNWLEGRVERPRRWQDLARVAAALRLGPDDADRLLRAGGHPSLAALVAEAGDPADRALLAPWRVEAQQAAAAAPIGRAPATGLPAQLTPLIGRDGAIDEVAALLARPELRLLTLSGPGGIGKTRLAIAVAAAARRRFPDGVWFVPLAAIVDAELVAPIIAGALGLNEGGGQPLRERLLAYLRERELLLVLDNCEQIAALAGPVVELLSAAPGLKLLCTSRALLRLTGEWEYAVPPLGLPSDGPAPDLARIVASPAVQLFVGRVQMGQPGFGLHAENAAAVAEICRRLDGLPLALELAAARARLFTPQALLARLEHRLSLLTGGPQDLPTRQQTLRATLDWSYGLLTGTEQWLLRQAAAFAGGFGLAAAEAVSGPPPAVPVLVDLLASLADKSMLRQEQGPDGEPRFAMLQMVREYALERLEESGELAATRERHARCYVELAEAAEPHLRRAEWRAWTEWLHRLDADYDNIRAALEWALAGPGAAADPTVGRRLVGALGEYWWTRGLAAEGLRWISAEAALGPDERTPGRVVALAWGGMLAQSKGDHSRARALCEAAVALGEQVGDRQALAFALRLLGGALRQQGELAAGTIHLERSLALCLAIGDLQAGARVLHHLAYTALYAGDFAGANAQVEEGLGLCAELSYEPEVGNSLRDMQGIVARYEGDAERAAELLQRSLARYRETGYRRGAALTLYNLGLAALATGDLGRAAAMLGESVALRRALGDRAGVAECLEGLAAVALASGDAPGAARQLGAAAALRELAAAPVRAIDHAAHQATVAAARAALPPAAFERAWAAGAAAPPT